MTFVARQKGKTMDDLISRQAAITIPILPVEHREYQTMNLDDAYELGWFDCQKCIEDLPSAQPERKTGNWIKISPANIYECSECGKNVMTDDISAYDFCHGCGADMKGENNG